MADKVGSVGAQVPQQLQLQFDDAGKAGVPVDQQAVKGPDPTQPTIMQHGAEVAQVLFDTRDESGSSEKAFAVLQKDWGRFVEQCNGGSPKPLPMDEANNDLKDYVDYMMKNGDKVKIGSTDSNMKEIIATNLPKAQQLSQGNGFFFAMHLSHLIVQDPRIPNDYCFLRQPAEEFMNSAVDFLQEQKAQ
jgi:hypothetical protein